MARTALTVTNVALTGTTMTLSAANVDGHSIPNPQGDIFVIVTNGGGGSITVTTTTPGTFHGLALPDPAASIGAGVTAILGPFRPTSVYNNADGVYIDFSGVTSVTVGAFSLGG